jgi:hypothetical protein
MHFRNETSLSLYGTVEKQVDFLVRHDCLRLHGEIHPFQRDHVLGPDVRFQGRGRRPTRNGLVLLPHSVLESLNRACDFLWYLPSETRVLFIAGNSHHIPLLEAVLMNVRTPSSSAVIEPEGNHAFLPTWMKGYVANWGQTRHSVQMYKAVRTVEERTQNDPHNNFHPQSYGRYRVMSRRFEHASLEKPDIVFFLDGTQHEDALAECAAVDMPTVAVCHPSTDPRKATYPILGNPQSLLFQHFLLQLVVYALSRSFSSHSWERRERKNERERAFAPRTGPLVSPTGKD